jgi:hypothetical protein
LLGATGRILYDPLAAYYFYCCRCSFQLLALAAEDWDRAAARGFYPSGVWERVSVSFYVYSGFVFDFVGCCSSALGVFGFFVCLFFAFP